MSVLSTLILLLKSPSMRREWIEIFPFPDNETVSDQSPSMRREWIEINIDSYSP